MTDNDRELLRKDGGPAFPVHPRVNIHEPHAGMSLRDWFAGMALQGMTANPERYSIIAKQVRGDDAYLLAVDAEVAYKLADAMLAQREKP